MSQVRNCPRCNGPIPSDAPGGECPRCLMAAGLETAEGSQPSVPPFSIDELDKIFTQLDVIELIGQGGMGVVYKARQRSLDRTVALKILPRDVAADPAFAERFNREARALARLSHPNIVTVFESGRADDLYYLIMEYVDGVTLDVAQREGRMTPEEALAVVPQICDALQYAHDRGIVHRDIKPANILLERGGQVKIADFGLAKLLYPVGSDYSLTSDGQVMGTAHYMAPEQIQSPRDVDHRADIFSLGVVFYEMLTGQLPLGRFPAPSEKVEVDVRLDRVVLRALETERERRYQRAEEVKTEVRSIGESRPARGQAPRHGYAPRYGREPKSVPPTGDRQLHWLVVPGLLFLPTAAFAGFVASELGAKFLAVTAIILTVAATGMIMSAAAWLAIRADPERLSGHRLATIGVVAPLLLGVLALLLAWEKDFMKTSGDKEQLLRESVVKWLYEIDELEGTTDRKAFTHMIDPERRKWFSNISDQKFSGMKESGELGLVMIEAADLRDPIIRFEIADLSVEGDSGYVIIRHGIETIRFPVVWRSNMWYLGIGKMTQQGTQ